MADHMSGDLSLEEIENDRWGDPDSEATCLMFTVHRSRCRHACSLAAEDFRVLIGQGVGLEVLLPLALARLAHDPLLEGDFYPGDVPTAVLHVPNEYWVSHPAKPRELQVVIESFDTSDEVLAEEIENFRRRQT